MNLFYTKTMERSGQGRLAGDAYIRVQYKRGSPRSLPFISRHLFRWSYRRWSAARISWEQLS